MKILQKIVFIGILVLSALYLVFTLGLATNVALGSSRVAELYELTQDVNHVVFTLAIWGVVITGISYIIGNHKNENYFIPNFVSSAIASLYFLVVPVITIIKVLPLKALFLESMDVDDISIQILLALNVGKVNTFIYDAGIVVSVLLFIFAGLSIYITIKKYDNKVKSAKIKKLNMEVS